MAGKYQCHGVTRGGSRCKRTADNKGFCKDHPFENGLVTKTGFAKLQGVATSRVSQWLKDWTIVADDDGFIEWKKAQLAIESSQDPSKARMRKGEPHPVTELASEDLELGDIDPGDVDARYQMARMRKLEEQARIEELTRLEEEGRLVDIEEVQRDAEEAGIALQAALMSIPDRVAPELASMASVKDIHAYLSEEIRDALSDLSSDFAFDGNDAA